MTVGCINRGVVSCKEGSWIRLLSGGFLESCATEYYLGI